jgi:hypothetical protein
MVILYSFSFMNLFMAICVDWRGSVSWYVMSLPCHFGCASCKVGWFDFMFGDES